VLDIRYWMIDIELMINKLHKNAPIARSGHFYYGFYNFFVIVSRGYGSHRHFIELDS
jgi:hypothetical protein